MYVLSQSSLIVIFSIYSSSNQTAHQSPPGPRPQTPDLPVSRLESNLLFKGPAPIIKGHMNPKERFDLTNKV